MLDDDQDNLPVLRLSAKGSRPSMPPPMATLPQTTAGRKRLDVAVIRNPGEPKIDSRLHTDNSAPCMPRRDIMEPSNLPTAHGCGRPTPSKAGILYHELAEEPVYSWHGIEVADSNCIFDVGANIGLNSLLLAREYRRLRVFAFEPVAPVYALLERNLALHRVMRPIDGSLYLTKRGLRMLHPPLAHAGTKVAGVAAAITNNNDGIAGLAYNVRLLNGKSMDDDGRGSASMASDGIRWAVANGADVINLSTAGTAPFKSCNPIFWEDWFDSGRNDLQEAINEAWAANVVIVAGDGNRDSDDRVFPAACDHVLSVANTNVLDQRGPNSSFGSWVNVAAPGTGVLTTLSNSATARRPVPPWRPRMFRRSPHS